MNIMAAAVAARSVLHATFTIERVYAAAPGRVFAAFADAEAKRRWFFCDSTWPVEHRLEFRVGGRETIRTGPAGGTVHLCEAVYHDIVPDQRIIYSYAMLLDQRRISVSLATLDFQAGPDGGTRLLLTEQGAFLDGWTDVAGREEGTRIGLENLAADLRQQSPAA
ncbi:SRPBCC family protein [Ferrovibrio sp.]|uniref:SRPBCC family protein n=1 Tax=Ferrovibrio sp. TaxID=1917215 RepID=UPI00261B3185|nr:SRPBCC family protein [Ferrovibrio sp.]